MQHVYRGYARICTRFICMLSVYTGYVRIYTRFICTNLYTVYMYVTRIYGFICYMYEFIHGLGMHEFIYGLYVCYMYIQAGLYIICKNLQNVLFYHNLIQILRQVFTICITLIFIQKITILCQELVLHDARYFRLESFFIILLVYCDNIVALICYANGTNNFETKIAYHIIVIYQINLDIIYFCVQSKQSFVLQYLNMLVLVILFQYLIAICFGRILDT
eukprot:TRINITY_DN642_c0_g1_i2.p1 TRINITY_DN642_c0_g1~~TRINITY_DN642_c0_g1_i2.p1  ORF type:complete len:219 (-),score=-25.81 TRINITY_DN642_c0_g1_i2:156-812(-)